MLLIRYVWLKFVITFVKLSQFNYIKCLKKKFKLLESKNEKIYCAGNDGKFKMQPELKNTSGIGFKKV